MFTVCTSHVVAEPASALLHKSANERIFILTAAWTVSVVRVMSEMLSTSISNDRILVKLVMNC